MIDDQNPEECFVQYLDEPYSEISISIVDSVQRGYGLSSYVGYIIKITYPKELTVERRFSQFAALREVLVGRWPGVMIPPLPAKYTSGSNSLKVVNERFKYLSYFLNNCVRLNFIFMSEQFQLFLTSNSSNLKQKIEKFKPLPSLMMLDRYEKAFPEIRASQERRGQLMVLMKDQLKPFTIDLQSQRFVLINLKKEVFKLAQRRQEYLKTTKQLYLQTLPAFQNHLGKASVDFKPILLQNEQIKQATSDLRESTAKNYWIVYQALKLQLAESQAMVQALQSRVYWAKKYEHYAHKIQVNEQQLTDIKLKKKTLKQFFSKSNSQLIKQLQNENKNLKEEMESLKIFNLFVAEVVSNKLIENYNKRREKLWRLALQNYVCKQKQLNNLREVFYKLLLKA